jgi:hypothetical protein
MERSAGGHLGNSQGGWKVRRGDSSVTLAAEVRTEGDDQDRDSEHNEVHKSEEVSGKGK